MQVRPASLDHSMWFHRPVRADEWLRYEMASPIANEERGMVIGYIYNMNGELVATVAQEGLIRLMEVPQQAPESNIKHMKPIPSKL